MSYFFCSFLQTVANAKGLVQLESSQNQAENHLSIFVTKLLLNYFWTCWLN